jgi:hypothetical protein
MLYDEIYGFAFCVVKERRESEIGQCWKVEKFINEKKKAQNLIFLLKNIP